MKYEEKNELYKERTLSERLSAAATFLRQNAGVLYKNTIIPAIPLVMLLAYFLLKYIEMAQEFAPALASGEIPDVPFQGMLFLPVAMIFSLFLFSMSGAVMSLYEEGGLSTASNWSNLCSKMYSNAGKLLLICLAMTLIFVIACLLFGMLVAIGGTALKSLLIFLFFFLLIAVIPALSLVIFPALFQGASTFASIKKGFSLGLKNWGTTVATLIIAGVMAGLVSIVLSLPFDLYTALNSNGNSIVIYLLAVLWACGGALTTPFIFVFLAFQYFSIAEKITEKEEEDIYC